MAPIATFETGLKIAKETANGAAPGGSTNAHWFQGGMWVPLTTEGLPSLQTRQAVIFAAGAAGNRNVNSRAPVMGRRWSDGGFSFPVTQDFISLLFYGALGTASTNEVPSTDAELASGTPLMDNTACVVDLSAQPSDGGAILRFRITAGSAGMDGGGTISISGIDADGRGASEVISFGSAGSFYSRNSYSAIGPSSITITAPADGVCHLTGVKHWTHTFTTGPSNPTFSIERQGDPTAGATSRSHMHTCMVVQELTLNTPAAQRDGLFTGNVTFEGNFPATCDATSKMAASSVEVWPAWGLSITRDSSAWNKAENATLTINSGNRNYRAAAGVQTPQGTFFGPREVTGSFDILVDDEGEFNRWLGASSHQLVFNWDTPHRLTSVQNQAISASMGSVYLENVEIGDSDDAFSLSADFRSIEDADTGTLKVQVISGTPGVYLDSGVD